jgi:hypothetical protein
LFRLQIQAARRYLFDTELKELLEECGIPLEVADPTGPAVALTVADCSVFMQGLKQVAGEDKAVPFGRDAFNNCTSIIVRSGNLPPILRAVSSADKLFLRVRDAMSAFNRKVGSNILVKWHGGAESELFDDTAQHCYGYTAAEPICETMTGFLEAAILYLSGVKVAVQETECMAKGAFSCRWHCTLA